MLDGVTAGGFCYLGVSLLSGLAQGAGGVRRGALLATYVAAGFLGSMAIHR